MHQLQNQEQSIRFHSGQMLAVANDDFGNADLTRATERLVQNSVSFFPALLRLQKIRFIEELWVNLFQINEIGDVDGMSGLDSNLLEILLIHDDITAAFVLEPFYDLIGGDFFGIGLGDLFVFDRAEIARPKLAKANFLFARGRINRHRDINQPKADTAFPDRTHIAGAASPTLPSACQPSSLSPISKLPCNFSKRSDVCSVMNFLAFMNIGGQELIFILLIILLLFGAKKLPELARGMGKAVTEFQKAKDEFSDEIHKAGKSETETAKSDVKPAQSTVPRVADQPMSSEVRPDPNQAITPGDKADQV